MIGRMPKLLLNLRNVPDDESDEVRALLDDNGIEFYETLPSRWGISHGGIWAARDEDAARAERLLADYQHTRRERARAEHAAAVRAGTAETFATLLRREPLRVLLAVLGILAALALVALVPVLLWR